MSIRTKAQLATEANANINTNGNNAITGAIHNAMLNNTFDSLCSIVDAETWNGVKTFGSFPITPSAAPTTDYQVANKKYVDDNIGTHYIYKTSVNFGTNNLGTVPETLVAAQGTGTWIHPISVVMYMSVVSTLDVGSQNLVIVDGSELFGFVDNTTLEAVTSGNTIVWKLFEQGTKNVFTIRENQPLQATFSSGADPTTGEASILMHTYYTVETFALP